MICDDSAADDGDCDDSDLIACASRLRLSGTSLTGAPDSSAVKPAICISSGALDRVFSDRFEELRAKRPRAKFIDFAKALEEDLIMRSIFPFVSQACRDHIIDKLCETEAYTALPEALTLAGTIVVAGTADKKQAEIKRRWGAKREVLKSVDPSVGDKAEMAALEREGAAEMAALETELGEAKAQEHESEAAIGCEGVFLRPPLLSCPVLQHVDELAPLDAHQASLTSLAGEITLVDHFDVFLSERARESRLALCALSTPRAPSTRAIESTFDRCCDVREGEAAARLARSHPAMVLARTSLDTFEALMPDLDRVKFTLAYVAPEVKQSRAHDEAEAARAPEALDRGALFCAIAAASSSSESAADLQGAIRRIAGSGNSTAAADPRNVSRVLALLSQIAAAAGNVQAILMLDSLHSAYEIEEEQQKVLQMLWARALQRHPVLGDRWPSLPRASVAMLGTSENTLSADAAASTIKQLEAVQRERDEVYKALDENGWPSPATSDATSMFEQGVFEGLQVVARSELIDFSSDQNLVESQDDQIEMSTMIHSNMINYLKTLI